MLKPVLVEVLLMVNVVVRFAFLFAKGVDTDRRVQQFRVPKFDFPNREKCAFGADCGAGPAGW